MRVIPVLDLKGGVTVHARYGQRETYRPVISCLTPSADPLSLASAFRDRLRLSELYIADLDAIAGGPGHVQVVSQLIALGMRVMIDAGTGTVDDVARVLDWGVAHAIVGTETLESIDVLAAIQTAHPGRIIVSLDMKAGRVLSRSPQLADQLPAVSIAKLVDAGVEELIVLDLRRVGSAAGPYLPADVIAALGSRRWLVGGGVRGVADLLALERAGASGALVGTALHTGTIGPAELSRLVPVKREAMPCG